ncbi:hypothetical protein SHIRM173S_07084 [Streptomyces hirsutus]
MNSQKLKVPLVAAAAAAGGSPWPGRGGRHRARWWSTSRRCPSAVYPNSFCSFAVDRRVGLVERALRVTALADAVGEDVLQGGDHGLRPADVVEVPELVEQPDALGRQARLELVGGPGDRGARRDVEAVGERPVLLVLLLVDPQPLHVLLGGLDVLALRVDEHRPAAVGDRLLARVGDLREGEDPEIVTERLLHLRHRPHAAPLDGGEPLVERGGVPEVGRRVEQQITAGEELAQGTEPPDHSVRVVGDLVPLVEGVGAGRPDHRVDDRVQGVSQVDALDLVRGQLCCGREEFVERGGDAHARLLEHRLAVEEELRVVDHPDPVDLPVDGVRLDVGRVEVVLHRLDQVGQVRHLAALDELDLRMELEDVRGLVGEQGGEQFALEVGARDPLRGHVGLLVGLGVAPDGLFGAGLAVGVEVLDQTFARPRPAVPACVAAARGEPAGGSQTHGRPQYGTAVPVVSTPCRHVDVLVSSTARKAGGVGGAGGPDGCGEVQAALAVRGGARGAAGSAVNGGRLPAVVRWRARKRLRCRTLTFG